MQRKGKVNGSNPFAVAEQVNAAVQQLNNNQQTLGKLINQTNRGVVNAFTIQDGHLHVHRRVFNDVAKEMLLDGGKGSLLVLQDGTIDWQRYYHEYEMLKVAIAFAMWLREIVGDKPVKEIKEGEDFVFGGDYANSNHTEN